MSNEQSNATDPRKSLRLWPGVAALVLLLLVWLVAPAVLPGLGGLAIAAGMVLALSVFFWWLFFSRAPWLERLGAMAILALAGVATYPFLHVSMRTGMMGMLFVVYAVPAFGAALVLWAALSRRVSPARRWALLVAAAVVASGAFTLLRTEGVTGDAQSDFKWRWTPTAEQQVLAKLREEPTRPALAVPSPPSATVAGNKAPSPEVAVAAAAPSTSEASDRGEAKAKKDDAVDSEWPGFRGPARDSVVRGLRIETGWANRPPAELWRRPIGPGWSSFAIRGDLVYTQEQRGEDEIVSSYRLGTGQPVWTHRDPVRFWESNGGAGPRATPAVHGDRVYALGATGILNALDAATGAVVWSRNAGADTAVETPGWGFAGSPLIVDDLVVVALSGRLAAYDLATGKQRWLGPEGGSGYASPHLATIGGVRQILLLRGSRTISVAPADGVLLWEHVWEAGVGILQPAMMDGDLLLTVGDAMGGVGMRRIAVDHDSSRWNVQERWTSRGLKPYFNDFVVHDGHAFGFDGSILACIDLADGTRKWKGGRYGHGQLVLLADQGLLLVLSEEGELALVRAAPDQFTEIARYRAMDGKTWNHPALVGDLLLVRNGEEMVAFRLPRSAR